MNPTRSVPHAAAPACDDVRVAGTVASVDDARALAGLKELVPRMRGHATTIFGEMSALAAELGAVNLGQGFPDSDGPQQLKDIAIGAIRDGSGNQYPTAHGLPDLRAAIAEHQRRWYGLDVDPADGVVVSTGASEALAAALLALVQPGDEVLVLEPYFDLYSAAISLAGGRKVSVPLLPPSAPGEGFRLDSRALRSAVTPRARLLLLNSPHNPTGMVLSETELAEVAAVVREHDLLVLSDEAYEHLVFEPARHIPIATLPGMADRTITVGSGGKSFSFTGWKVGWASGPASLIRPVRVVRQHLSYVSGGPFQPAMAAGLRLPDRYFSEFAAELAAKRDRLSRGLGALGFGVCGTEGTYFVVTDVRPVGFADGLDFCQQLPARAGVVAIPVQALCDGPVGDPYVRWTFCKQRPVLDEALRRLGQAFAGSGAS